MQDTRRVWGFANNPQSLLILYATLQGLYHTPTMFPNFVTRLSIEGIGEGISKNEMHVHFSFQNTSPICFLKLL
jgi:hypothetical protein